MAQHGSLAVALTAREALVRSAAELFARSGFDGVSVREINRQAGLSAAAAHYHFNSKEVLFQEVLTRGTELVKPRMAARLTELNARSKPPSSALLVRAVAETYSELLEDDPEYGEYWLQIVSHLSDFELASLDGTLESLMQSAIAKIFPAVAPQERAFIWRMAVMTLINRLPEASSVVCQRSSLIVSVSR